MLIKEDHVKPVHFPMGIVKNIITNINGEITGATVLKGKTGELTKRHANSLIPLLSLDGNPSEDSSEISAGDTDGNDAELAVRPRSTRKAALESIGRTKTMLEFE